MSPTQTNKKQPVHITVYQDKHHALNFADRLEIGKVGLFVGQYPAGGGKMTRRMAHFMDVDDARWVLRALISGREGFQYKECKGSDKRHKGEGVEMWRVGCCLFTSAPARVAMLTSGGIFRLDRGS